MRCPYCGHNNPNKARKCMRCGRRLDTAREKRREKTILLYGIVLIALILAAGIGAMFGVSHVLENRNGAEEAPQKVKIVTTPRPTKEAVEETTAASVTEETAEPTQAPEPTEEPLTGTIVDSGRQAQIDLLGYSKVTVASSVASSTIVQEGIDNTPHVMYDGQDWSSWQDGVDGDGIGENITFTFDRVYKIKFLVFKLGNWYGTDDYYMYNNRPQKMTFELGNESFDVTFPDEKREICVELNREVETSSLKMTINSVYKGSLYEDTCINEVTIYGFGTGAATAQATTVPNTYDYTYVDPSQTAGTDAAGAGVTDPAAGTDGTTGVTGTDQTGVTGGDAYTYTYTDPSAYTDPNAAGVSG